LSKLASTLKDEITRLGRKEARRLALPLKRRITTLERLVRDQRVAMKQLARQAAAVPRAAAASSGAPPGQAADSRELDAVSIKRERERLGMTQRDLGKRIGVTHVAVYLWESGRSKPQGRNRKVLQKVLGLRAPRPEPARAAMKPGPKPGRKPAPMPKGPTPLERALAAQAARRRERG